MKWGEKVKNRLPGQTTPTGVQFSLRSGECHYVAVVLPGRYWVVRSGPRHWSFDVVAKHGNSVPEDRAYTLFPRMVLKGLSYKE